MRLIALAGLAVVFVIPLGRADEPAAQAATAATTSKSGNQSEQSQQGSIAKQYAQIRDEYEAAKAAYRRAAAAAKSPRDTQEVSTPRSAAPVAYCRRMIDLAESSPGDPAARDALLWVMQAPIRADAEFVRAGALLVRHHGDDPEAVRIGLTLSSNVLIAQRDALLFGFYVAAKGHEAKGLARLALAQYLDGKANAVDHARSVNGRPKHRFYSGGKVVREFDLTDEEYADRLALRYCDPRFLRADAVRLYEEVIAEYGNIPHVTLRHLELEALVKEPAPQWNGKPMTDQRRRSLEAALARKRTLGQEAVDRLDVMLNLAVVGKPAPEIEGVDMDGKPLKLSDYKGKVVVLVFWGTWCGPCMAMVPRERDIVARLKGQPFALLGIDCKDNKETARKVIARERMTWPSWYDGADDTGPIAKRYHVRGYPSIVVIDGKGIIRRRGLFSFDQDVDKLLEEMKRPTSTQGAAPTASQE